MNEIRSINRVKNNLKPVNQIWYNAANNLYRIKIMVITREAKLTGNKNREGKQDQK